MAEIIYKKGNLVDATEHIIVHGCNAQGVMNSGVAKVIRNKWPDAYRIYREHYEKRGRLFPGEVIWAPVDNKIIAHCITQYNYGRDKKKYTEYNAVRACMKEIDKFGYKELGLAMPLIGAGLGGGDWEIISQIIQEEITNVNPSIYVLPEQWNILNILQS